MWLLCVADCCRVLLCVVVWWRVVDDLLLFVCDSRVCVAGLIAWFGVVCCCMLQFVVRWCWLLLVLVGSCLFLFCLLVYHAACLFGCLCRFM